MGRFGATLAVLFGVMAAVAVPASAHEFTGSVAGAPRLRGEGEQVFVFKPFTITCESAKSVPSEYAWAPQMFYVEVKYSRCTTPGVKYHGTEFEPAKVKFLTPVDFEYHANGIVQMGAEANGEIATAGAIELTIKDYKCVVSWEPQSVPAKMKKGVELYEAAKFTPEKVEGKGKNKEQEKLVIENKLTKMKYELSEGICEGFSSTEGKSGSYTGTLVAELKGADFGWM